eukprot:gene30052-36295_t
MTVTLTRLPFTVLYGEHCHGVDDVLYEFITNALDASPANTFPTVELINQGIIIEDAGSGLLIKHISNFGGDQERNPAKHGSHGTGLKDAIAICVRLNMLFDLSIETVGTTFTFRKSSEDANVIAVGRSNGRTEGTKVSLTRLATAREDFTKIRKRFLFLMDPIPAQSHHPDVQVYQCDIRSGAVMMKGVKKDNHAPLGFLYNFVQPTMAQKQSITRIHTFDKGAFQKHFRQDILRANPQETFGGQFVPHPVPPAVAAISTQQQPRTVQGDLARELDERCMEQDYYVWTLTSNDREKLQRAAACITNDVLRSIDGISVAATSEQGSLAKNTFVPLSSDIDIIVEINGFHGHEAEICEGLKNKLREHNCRMEDSGNHILNFTFQGIAFDLVLIDAAKTDARSRDLAARMERKSNVNGATNHQQQSFMRAVKYWAKRQHIAIKSCVKTEHPFRYFLSSVAAVLRTPLIQNYYELASSSIAEVGEKAVATLALLK